MLSKATIGRARGEERNAEPNISTVKVGVKNLIPKVDFDRVMAERLAQFGSYSLV